VLPGHELAKDAARLLATLLPLALKGAVDFEEIENPISPPNTTAYSVVTACKPTI
jgi:hypothetical protein